LQRTGVEPGHGAAGERVRGGLGHPEAEVTEPKSGDAPVEHTGRVVDFAVADEVKEGGCHGTSLLFAAL
jgi:hypothetical protein